MDVYAQMEQSNVRISMSWFTNFMTFVTFCNKIHVL